MRLRYLLLITALSGLPAVLTAQTSADLFDDSVVHEIRFTMNPADWQTLKNNIQADTNYKVTGFQWTGANNLTAGSSNLAIHSRGHGSRDARKPGLHVSFNTYVSTQTFLGLTDIDLKSNTEDPTLLHERLSMLLFRRLGVPASREVHSRVYMNGDYIGLYNIVEAVDQDFLQLNFKENNGYLFEYTPGDWTGQIGFGWHFEYLGQDLTKYAITPPANAAAPFEPKTHSNAPDTVSLEEFFRTMNQTSGTSFITAMAPYLDLKPWLTHIAVENYVTDFDCILGDVFGANNFYLYRFQALPNGQPPNPLFKFIAWDKDLAFDWAQRPILQNASQNVLMNGLISVPEYRNSYFDSLMRTTMLAGTAGGWLEQETIREYNQIKQAAYDDPNKLRLDSGNHVPVSNSDFDAYVATLITFASLRTPEVTSQLAGQGYQTPAGYPSLAPGGTVRLYSAAPPAAGGFAAIYGSNFGTADTTTVYVNGYAAPIVFASPGQIDVQIPWQTTGSVMVGAVVNGAPSNLIDAFVNVYAPEILAVTHADGTPVTTATPAAANEVVIAYANGLGPVNGPMVTGQKASGTSLQSTTQQATASVGGAPAIVSFSGLTPGYFGLYQVNLQIPANLSSGAQSQLVIAIGGQSSGPATLPVR